VIFVRRDGDVHVDAKLSGNFVNNLTLPIAGGISTVTSTRGWTAVDVVAKRRSFRFVNTHLEAFSNFYRSAQAFELIAGPLATALPTVLVGDLNSAPDDPPFTEQVARSTTRTPTTFSLPRLPVAAAERTPGRHSTGTTPATPAARTPTSATCSLNSCSGSITS
jgi:endonuclease/exonuclease/phosphatase family metal-dependent hydrolase